MFVFTVPWEHVFVLCTVEPGTVKGPLIPAETVTAAHHRKLTPSTLHMLLPSGKKSCMASYQGAASLGSSRIFSVALVTDRVGGFSQRGCCVELSQIMMVRRRMVMPLHPSRAHLSAPLGNGFGSLSGTFCTRIPRSQMESQAHGGVSTGTCRVQLQIKAHRPKGSGQGRDSSSAERNASTSLLLFSSRQINIIPF